MENEQNTYYLNLIERLRALPNETEWVEFKVDNRKPEMIGEYISALSNSAVLKERERAYILWGIDDTTHEIKGTSFRPKQAKQGNEELENWLSTQLTPRVDFKILEVETPQGLVSILEIPRATFRPTAFKGTEYIRNGTYKKLLRDFPEKERKLWLSFEKKPYELRVATENVSASGVTDLLDCAAYYTLMKLPLPENRSSIIHDMIDRDFILEQDNGLYSVTNMGALLFAKDINRFDSLKRKAVRVIRYSGNGKTNAIREDVFTKGYAIEFDEVVRHIMTLIPQKETFEGGLRIEHVMFPEKSIREMLGNIIIHQDLTVHGAGPIMEVFDAKIEATSPGGLLVDVDRIIDTAPHSRNEAMAAFLRIVHICEERGSGFDRIEEGMRDLRIPAPKVESAEDFCRTKLYWHEKLTDWTREERIRTCYLYTCYCYVNEMEVSNSVIRDRFGIEAKNMSTASRIIKEAFEEGKIKLSDPNAAPKMRRYVPYWT